MNEFVYVDLSFITVKRLIVSKVEGRENDSSSKCEHLIDIFGKANKERGCSRDVTRTLLKMTCNKRGNELKFT